MTRHPFRFDVVTIFPRMVLAGLAEGVVSRGIARGLIDMAVHDLRDHTADRTSRSAGGSGTDEPFVACGPAVWPI
jgi:tRNA G37 N-methylase TrmD